MAKKNPTKYGKQMKKDPGIPNLYPFKAQLMQRVSSCGVFGCGFCMHRCHLCACSKSAQMRA